MKNTLVILLAMFVGISVVGCKENVFKEKETKVHRDANTYSGIWVLSVDVKEDKLLSSIKYVDKFMTEKNFVKIRTDYLKKVNPEEQVIDVCKVTVDIGVSYFDIDSKEITFYILLRDGSNNLINPYDQRVMKVVEEMYSLLDDLEKGEIR